MANGDRPYAVVLVRSDAGRVLPKPVRIDRLAHVVRVDLSYPVARRLRGVLAAAARVPIEPDGLSAIAGAA